MSLSLKPWVVEAARRQLLASALDSVADAAFGAIGALDPFRYGKRKLFNLVIEVLEGALLLKAELLKVQHAVAGGWGALDAL